MAQKTAKYRRTERKGGARPRRLFRVIFRGKEIYGTAEQFHAKVVAHDFAEALSRACEALNLDATKVDSAAVTLIAEDTELADGKVFDLARRSRGFGERGGWVFRDALPAKESRGPRDTEWL
jgi:hypothetical protein